MTPWALYLVGAPGSGKSTLMAEVREQLGVELGPEESLSPLRKGILRGQPLEDLATGARRGFSLGRHREGFPGTDTLSMQVTPVAVEWAQQGDVPQLLLGEGMRLGNVRFLSTLAQVTRLTVCHLSAPADVLDERCATRGSNQNERFRKGATTQARNTMIELEQMGDVTVRYLRTERFGVAESAEYALGVARTSKLG